MKLNIDERERKVEKYSTHFGGANKMLARNPECAPMSFFESRHSSSVIDDSMHVSHTEVLVLGVLHSVQTRLIIYA